MMASSTSPNDSINCSRALLGLLQLVGRNIQHVERRAQRFILPNDGALGHQVNKPVKAVLRTQRQLDHDGVRMQLGAQLADAGIKIRADAVHFVDEDDARHAIFVGLAPYGFGLRLHALRPPLKWQSLRQAPGATVQLPP